MRLVEPVAVRLLQRVVERFTGAFHELRFRLTFLPGLSRFLRMLLEPPGERHEGEKKFVHRLLVAGARTSRARRAPRRRGSPRTTPRAPPRLPRRDRRGRRGPPRRQIAGGVVVEAHEEVGEFRCLFGVRERVLAQRGCEPLRPARMAAGALATAQKRPCRASSVIELAGDRLQQRFEAVEFGGGEAKGGRHGDACYPTSISTVRYPTRQLPPSRRACPCLPPRASRTSRAHCRASRA